MKILFFKLGFFLLLFGCAETSFSQVRLSEIMFDPIGSEYYDEFIEIQNRSSRDTIDLSGWRVGDEKSLDLIKDAGFGLRLGPGQFGIILDSGYFTHSTTYDSLIPSDALILTIADKAFGSGGLSNSIAEKVSLVNDRGDTVDAYRYTLDNSPGFSDERIDIFQDSFENNWANSLQLNGTPGFRNSVSPSDKDLALISVRWDSVLFQNEGKFSGTALLKNVGITPAVGGRVLIFDDKNFDRVFAPSEQCAVWPIGRSVLPKDTVSVPISLDHLSPGIHSFLVSVDWPPDEKKANNLQKIVGVVQFPLGVLRVNEIMYRPSAGFPEWIEIKNVSLDTLQLYQWQFSDKTTGHSIKIFDTQEELAPGGYRILAKSHIPDLPDSLSSRETIVHPWPTLNYSGDQVWIFDSIKQPLDSVDYSSWPLTPTGHSLERLEYLYPSENSEKWEESRPEGGTPGRPNSINPLLVDGELQCLDDTPLLVKAKDSASVHLRLKNVGRLEINQGRLTVFDDWNGDGRFSENESLQQGMDCARALQPGDSMTCRMMLPWLASGKHPLLVKWEIPEDGNEKNNDASIEIWKGYSPYRLIINEIMYQTRSGWPEWIEIYNPQEGKVALQNWSICDRQVLAKAASLKSEATVFSRSFLVITGDSSFFDFYPEVKPDQVLVDPKFPTLNNDKDSLFLVDLSGTIVDELEYSSSWGGRNGHSLERIQPENPTADSTNWSTSVADAGSTPGKRNSIFLQINPASNLLSISPDPFSPDGDGKDDFVTFTIQTNYPTAVVELRIFDSKGRMIRTLLANQPVGSRYDCIWDGREKNGRILPMGIYIAYLELFVNHKKQKSIKKAFVLAKHL